MELGSIGTSNMCRWGVLQVAEQQRLAALAAGPAGWWLQACSCVGVV
jgi:hypothetical protein